MACDADGPVCHWCGQAQKQPLLNYTQEELAALINMPAVRIVFDDAREAAIQNATRNVPTYNVPALFD